MFGITSFWAFVAAGILLNLTPGADTMYILGRSISGGKKAGMLSAFGIAVGSLIHTLFAALGLSVLLAESQAAFETVKYLGAGYLIYLGIKLLLAHSKGLTAEKLAPIKNRKIFFSGILTNVLNPKVALFFLAFLPQFIDPSYHNSFVSFIILGIAFTTTGLIWCTILALFQPG